MDANQLQHLLEVIFPGAVLLIFVGALAFRFTVKPTVDAMLRLREGLRTESDETKHRIAQLEAEVARLRSGDTRIAPALEAGAWPKEPVRRD